jgi:hypothetical protein
MGVTIIISSPEIPPDLINELWVSATQYPEFDSFFPMHPTGVEPANSPIMSWVL